MNYTLFIFDRGLVRMERVRQSNWYSAVSTLIGGLIQEDYNTKMFVRVGETQFKPKVWVNEEGFPLRLDRNSFFPQYLGPVVVSFRDRFELVNLGNAVPQVRAILSVA